MASMTALRTFIVVAAGSLFVASLIHSGVILDGYRDRGAAVPEAVIGGVMLIGLTLTWAPGPWARRAAIGALAFGLLGSLVGVFTIVIGVGPRTVPDVVYHAALVAVLVAGLMAALRAPRRSTAMPSSSGRGS